MKVLFACPFVPWPLDSGGRIRTYNLVRCLGQRTELELHLIEEPRDLKEARAELEPLVQRLEIHSRSNLSVKKRWSLSKLERWFLSEKMDRLLASETQAGRFDVIHLDEMLLARRVPAQRRVPTVLHHHKLDTVLYAKVGAGALLERRFDLYKLERLERLAARRILHHVTCSAEDRTVLLERYPWLQVVAVPSGFDPNYFKADPLPPARDPARILFMGSLDYAPNVDGLIWFAAEVWPLLRERHPRLRLSLVGRHPLSAVRELAQDGIELVGPVEDVRPYLEGAAASIVPLRIGGGTRLKIVEALALRTPVVSTSIGAEGLGLTQGRELLLADSATEFAAAIGRLLGDPVAAAKLGEAGQARVREFFTWPVLADALLGAWQSAAVGSKGQE